IGCRHGDSLIPFLNLNFEIIRGLEIDINCYKKLAWEYVKFKYDYQLPIQVEEKNQELYTEIDFSIDNTECQFYFPFTYKEFEQQSVIYIEIANSAYIIN